MTTPNATTGQLFKQLVIAEKPSVAADISRALGGFTKHGDYFESPTMLIAAAAGHLLESLRPKTWALEALPILPPQLELVPKPKQEKRLAELVSLLARQDVAGVINACDAGREGELIFVEILRHSGCTKPVHRVWLQSMTVAAIRRAFDELRPAASFRGLAEAAICRNIADWWIGINMTKALTGIMKRAGRYDLTSAGRVQTPTLMMVCDRDLEIVRFSPKPYWLLTGSFTLADDRLVKAAWIARDGGNDDLGDDRGRRITSRDRAEAIIKKVIHRPATITSRLRLEKKNPPPLFKLNDLLAEASSKFGLPADRTQSIAQSLYEKKLITYPRTESQHLRPEDDLDTVRERLQQIAATVSSLAGSARDALGRGIDATNKRVFDSSKVGDHFALIPAEIPANPPPVTEGEQRIYDLVLRRFVAAFLPPSETNVRTLTFTVTGETFEAVTRTLCVPGWRAVAGKIAEALPADNDEVDEGAATAQTTGVVTEERMTTPPHGHFTDGTLLKAMESAGQLVDDEESQEAMRISGLGTAATRTETIKKLLADRYILRKGRELHATPKALALKKVLGTLKLDALTNPEMTGKWEARLAEIEAGTGATNAFMADIRRLAEDLVSRTVSSAADLVLEELPDIRMPGTNQPFVELLQDYATADGSVRIPKFAWGRYLLPSELHTLLTVGIIGPLEGFYSQRTKKHYDASLRWNAVSNRCEIFFDRLQEPSTKDHPQIGVCRHCGDMVHERQSRYVCVNATGESPSCGFALKRLWCGREITRDEAVQLLADGRTDVLEGFRGKNGRSFKASIAVGPDGKAAFHFPEKQTKQRRKPTSSAPDQK